LKSLGIVLNEFDFVVKREGAVASIDLNCPPEGNTLTRAMMTRLAQLLNELGSDPWSMLS
jgi:enoyl-CoA hydratase/carnithine racemase